MSLIPDKCILHFDSRSECVAFEKGKTYKLLNASKYKIKKVRIDNCILQNEGQRRCDYLLSIDDDNIRKVFFVELKGERLIDAVKQIHSTITYLKEEFKGFQLEARIVGSKDVPNIKNNPHYLKLKKIVDSSGGNIKRATNKYYSETI